MSEISGLGHVGLYCHDLKRMREFYSGFLGLTIADRDQSTVRRPSKWIASVLPTSRTVRGPIFQASRVLRTSDRFGRQSTYLHDEPSTYGSN